MFLYRNVLESEIGLLDGVVRAKRPARLPVVLTRHEARQLFAKMDGVVLLACRLLYGSGLRLLECLHLRVKDIESRRLPNTRIVTPAAATGITCMNPSSRGKGHAVRLAGITKPATPRAIRHSFATERLRKGHDIRTIQQLLGNSDVSTTMIHTHVLNRGRGVQSPADDL